MAKTIDALKKAEEESQRQGLRGDKMQIAAEGDPYPKLELREICDVLLRNKGKMVFVFSLVLLGVTLVTLLSPKIYRSEAKLLVRVGRENVTLDPTVTTGQVISINRSAESEINSELEILKSRELLEKLVDSIGSEVILNGVKKNGRKESNTAEANPTQPAIGSPFETSSNQDDREKAVSVLGSINVEVEKNTNIIHLSHDAKSPELAQEVLRKLIDLYLERHMLIHSTPGSYPFFNREVARLHNALVEKERDLKSIEQETGTTSVDEKQKLLLGRITSLEQDLAVAQVALTSSKVRAQELKSGLTALPKTVVVQEIRMLGEQVAPLRQELQSTQAALAVSKAKAQDYKNQLAVVSRSGTSQDDHPRKPGEETIRAKLYELKLKEQELLSKYTESSTPVKEMRRQIEKAQALLEEEEVTQTEREIRQTLVAELTNMSSLQAKVDTIEAELTRLNQAEGMRSRLHELKLKEQDLLSKNTNPEDTALKEVQREIAEVQDLLEKEETPHGQITMGANPTYQTLHEAFLTEITNMYSQESKVNILESQLADARLELKKFVDTEFRIQTMQRDISLLESKYRKHVESLEQARIDEALKMDKISNISTVQQPSFSRKPVRPRKVFNLALGVLLGSLGAFGIALISENMKKPVPNQTGANR